MNKFVNRPIQALNKRIEKIQSAQYATVDDCKLLITEACEQLENQNKIKDYPILTFYRNWLLHPNLKRYDLIIQEIDAQFDIPEYEQSTNDKIAGLFSTRKLRSELKSVLSSIDEHLPFLDVFSGWNDFMGSIFSILIHKPLIPAKPTNYVVRFYLDVLQEDQKVIWVCDARKQPDIIIPVWGHFPFDEFKTDFCNPL